MGSEEQEVHLEGQKLMYHVKEVSKWLDGEIVAPIYVEIGPINSCNHKCLFCALDYLKDKGKSIDKNVLIRALKNMAQFGVKSVMFAGEGEPFLYPYLPEVIENARQFNLDVAITTNGVLFSEEKVRSVLKNLSWVKFSIDAATEKTHANIHGCDEKDFARLMTNIKYACDFKKEHNLKCSIGCQILLIPDNIGEVEELIMKVKDLGVNYIALKPYSQHPSSINRMVLDLNKYDSILTEISTKHSKNGFSVIYRNKSAEEIEQKEISYDKCYGLNFFTLINSSGDVMPCNLFYERPEFCYGNINKNTFEEIWKGESRKRVLEKLYAMGCANCRKGCRLNFVNKYLDEVKNRNIKHINFI